jgi:hypothetical protein
MQYSVIELNGLCHTYFIEIYCDMTPKSQNIGTREALQRCPLLCSGLLIHFSGNKYMCNHGGLMGPEPESSSMEILERILVIVGPLQSSEYVKT